jgi:hypothetical protein
MGGQMMRSRLLIALVGLLLVGWTTGQAADESDSFFNGKNLDGWEGLTEYWSVQDGAIVGKAEDLKFNTFLCTKKKYRDFELHCKIRLRGGKGNSGVQIRSKIADQKEFAVAGPQADVGKGYWGSLYGERFGGMMKQADAAEVNKVLKEDEFNDYSIRVMGKHVTIKVGGVTTVDQDFPKMPDEGIIALQLHGNMGPMEVTFKDIEFKELNSK